MRWKRLQKIPITSIEAVFISSCKSAFWNFRTKVSAQPPPPYLHNLRIYIYNHSQSLFIKRSPLSYAAVLLTVTSLLSIQGLSNLIFTHPILLMEKNIHKFFPFSGSNWDCSVVISLSCLSSSPTAWHIVHQEKSVTIISKSTLQ